MSNQAIIEKLSSIASRVSALMDENQTLRRELENTKSDLKKLRNINEVQKNSIEILEQKNKLTNIASVVSSLSEEEKHGIKKTISIQIKEIDKCLKLLKN